MSKALGKEYDDSADQPFPDSAAVHWPAPAVPADEAAPAGPVEPPAVPEAGAAADGYRRIDITNDAEGARNLRRAVLAGVLGAYRQHGRLVIIDELEAMPAVRQAVSHGGRHLVVRKVAPTTMRRLLSTRAFVYKAKKAGRKVDDPWIDVETLPTVQMCEDVLDWHQWPGVPALTGVTSAPVLRPDGTIIQAPGHDPATGMYYAPALDVGHIPETPAQDQADAARDFVLEHVLGDFPWVDKADRANYLALLVAPILRHLNGGLLPLGAISAAAAGTGKTLLAGDIPAALYGLTSRPWVDSEDEVRKALSTILVASTKPVVLFDNVPEWRSVTSPMLSKLLTSASWDDRLLGENAGIEAENDRLWLVTGNSMTFGGDLPSRTVLVRLDAEMSRPDLRDPDQFRIGNLQAWLTEPRNAAKLLRALLIMIADWVAAGRREGAYVMRQFSPWARLAGGFLDHHGVHGFLANRSALDAVDDEGTLWLSFAHEWHSQFGNAYKTPTEVARSAAGDFGYDPWNGHYLTDGQGRAVTAVGLGKRLGGKIGKIFGSDADGFRLECVVDSRSGQRRYRIIRAADIHREGLDETPAAAAGAPRGQGALWDPPGDD